MQSKISYRMRFAYCLYTINQHTWHVNKYDSGDFRSLPAIGALKAAMVPFGWLNLRMTKEFVVMDHLDSWTHQRLTTIPHLQELEYQSIEMFSRCLLKNAKRQLLPSVAFMRTCSYAVQTLYSPSICPKSLVRNWNPFSLLCFTDFRLIWIDRNFRNN